MSNPLLDAMTEDQLKERVITLAQARGWLVHHDRPAPDPRQGGQLRTVIEGDKGFPDLVLARDGRRIFAELKRQKGRVSPEQQRWLDELGEGTYPDSVIVCVWRPSDWPQIEQTLA